MQRTEDVRSKAGILERGKSRRRVERLDSIQINRSGNRTSSETQRGTSSVNAYAIGLIDPDRERLCTRHADRGSSVLVGFCLFDVLDIAGHDDESVRTCPNISP